MRREKKEKRRRKIQKPQRYTEALIARSPILRKDLKETNSMTSRKDTNGDRSGAHLIPKHGGWLTCI